MNYRIFVVILALIGLVGLASAAAPVSHFYGNISAPPAPPDEGEYVGVWDFGAVGDGVTDDGAEIQAAIDYARDNDYPEVRLASGKTYLFNQVISLWAGLDFYGNNSEMKLKDNSALAGSGEPFFKMKGNSYIYNTTLNGNWQNGNRPNVNGLQFSGDNNIARYNTIKNVRSYSLGIYTGHNDIIENNTFIDNYQYAISTGSGDPEATWGYNVTVLNNTIYNSTEVGIKVRGTDGADIRYNTIYMYPDEGGYRRGISLYTLDYEAHNIVIHDNYIHGNLGMGSGSSDCISSDDENAFNVDIHDNYAENCDIGIDIWFDDGVIYDNTIDSSTYCVLDHGSGNSVYDNVCG